MYHHAKFHADRCHRRRDICNTQKGTSLRDFTSFELSRVKTHQPV